ncbi:MAG: hypothetical protein AAF928_19620 [Myxococcota bacterium]
MNHPRFFLVPLLLVATSCGAASSAPPPPAPQPPAPADAAPAIEPSSPPDPEPTTPGPQPCGQDPASEAPIAEGELGTGDRVVRLINNSGVEIQARLLDAAKRPALPGTLRIPSGASGQFRVSAGVYMIRYRDRDRCEVRRGGRLFLSGARAGVEISVRPRFESGEKSQLRRVPEPL